MSESKPPPPTLEPDDERIIQAFLERASAVVLDNSVLNAQHWGSLVALAEELGLSDEQLRETVNDLRDRGVIKAIDLAPPKPPPLPHAGQDEAAMREPEPAGESKPEVDFALTPPPAEPAPPPPPAPSAQSPIDRFLERANAIIAEQRGFGPRTRALLAATASEMELTDEEAAEALSRFESATPPEPPSYDDSEETAGRRRWRVQGQPPPEPSAPARKPAEIYREYLRASLAQIEDRIVTRFLEKKLLKHGTGVLSLAHVYATQVFHEEVASQKCHLESAAVAEETSEGDDEGTLSDPDVQIFLDRSVPILAEHRGITAKSRVLLNALAEELGLSQQQVENAIVAAQFRAATTQETKDAKQRERLEGFRALVQGTLVSLPRKILTRDIEADLMRHGAELHGLEPALVQVAIREVCGALEIRQISEDKARRHVEMLVDSKLVETPRLSMDTRLRILSEGEQWGLTSDEVAAIIKERTRAQEDKRRSEERFANGALLAAGMAILIVFGLFGWIMFGGGRVSSVPHEPSPPEGPTIVEEVIESEIDTDWWNSDLHADASNARLIFTSQREAFKQLESSDPSVRRSGYSRVIDLLTDGARTSQQEALLLRILSQAFEGEPDSDAASYLLDRVLSLIPKAEKQLFADERVYSRAFFAARIAAALVRGARGERQAEAVTAMGRAIDYSLDLNYDAARLDAICRDQTAERLLALLVALAETNPARAADVYSSVMDAIDFRDCLDERTLTARNTDFLISFLTASPAAWESFAPLIQDVIDSEDRANAVRMLRVYESTDNSDLREYMAELLLRVADVEVEDREVASVAMAVRKSLGVSDVAMADAQTRRFLQDADTVIRERPIDVGKPNAMIRQIVEFARLSALGCAAAIGEPGAEVFERLLVQDSDALLGGESRLDAVEDKPSSPEPSTHRSLNDSVRVLGNPKTTALSRANFLQRCARLTETISDVTPLQADVIAQYMLSRKRVEEHRIVVDHASELARWKQVRLAVADRLEDARLQPEELEQLVSQLLGREYKLQTGLAGREALRSELFHSVLNDLHREDVEGGDKYRAYDGLSHALQQTYASQAEVFRLPESFDESKTPPVVLQALTEHVAKQTLAGKLEPWQRQELERVSTELRAIDYHATSDLERQVLLDRSWLRLLVVRVAIRRPQRRSDADRLLFDLLQQDAKTTNVMHQLRDGQLAILKMWILENRPE
jgi:biotin operon repressor